jgi:hypothetical protein
MEKEVVMFKKPFPSRVRWGAVWRHRWLFLNLLNEIAHGDRAVAMHVVDIYGGSADFGRDLHRAAREAIITK